MRMLPVDYQGKQIEQLEIEGQHADSDTPAWWASIEKEKQH